MLDLIRIAKGYPLDVDFSQLSKAEEFGLVETIPIEDYQRLNNEMQSLEEKSSRAELDILIVKKELEKIDTKLDSIFYKLFPFKIFTENKKEELSFKRYSVQNNYDLNKSNSDALKTQLNTVKSQIDGYNTIDGICLRPTKLGIQSLPETIAEEFNQNWSHETHALYMIAAGFAINKDRFLEAGKLAKEIDKNWSHKTHALYTIAAALCDNNKNLFYQCVDLAIGTDDGWSHETRAFYTLAAGLTKGRSDVYENAVRNASIIDNGWSRESCVIYTFASIFGNNDQNKLKNARRQADKQDDGWSHETHALYMMASALADVDDRTFENGSIIANEIDKGWSHKSHAKYMCALSLAEYNTDKFNRAIKLADVLDNGWSHETHALYTIAALVNNKDFKLKCYSN